jgi:hypothetical protein
LQVGATNAYVPCYVHMWVVEYVIEKWWECPESPKIDQNDSFPSKWRPKFLDELKLENFFHEPSSNGGRQNGL